MLNTLLIDNDLKALTALEMMLDDYCPQICICGRATSHKEVVNHINNYNYPDLAILEIDTPQINGIEFSENKLSAYCDIIYVSENPSYALKAIKKQVIGFLVKPVKVKELLHAVRIAEEKFHQRKKSGKKRLLLKEYESQIAKDDPIGIPTMEGYEIIQPEDVIRCEGMQNCTRIITKERSDIISSYNLGKFIKLFGNEIFFSPHKSHLINFLHVKKYLKEGTIIMNDGSYIPVSKRRKIEILKYFKRI